LSGQGLDRAITNPCRREAGICLSQVTESGYENPSAIRVCNLFLFVEPLRGWRKVFVRDRRTKVDWAECVRVILDQISPKAICVRLVQDNLNTHTIGSLYEAWERPKSEISALTVV
jgi:hypothetical protein